MHKKKITQSPEIQNRSNIFVPVVPLILRLNARYTEEPNYDLEGVKTKLLLWNEKNGRGEVISDEQIRYKISKEQTVCHEEAFRIFDVQIGDILFIIPNNNRGYKIGRSVRSGLNIQ